MTNKNYSSISDITNSSNPLGKVGDILAILDELNKILIPILPKHIAKLCHIGAIDTKKNLVVVFVHDQQVHHLVYNMAQAILQELNKHHFKFSSIIVKVGHYQNNSQQDDDTPEITL